MPYRAQPRPDRSRTPWPRPRRTLQPQSVRLLGEPVLDVRREETGRTWLNSGRPRTGRASADGANTGRRRRAASPVVLTIGGDVVRERDRFEQEQRLEQSGHRPLGQEQRPPPIEWPKAWSRSTPTCRATATTSSAIRSQPRSTPASGSTDPAESPCPQVEGHDSERVGQFVGQQLVHRTTQPGGVGISNVAAVATSSKPASSPVGAGDVQEVSSISIRRADDVLQREMPDRALLRSGNEELAADAPRRVRPAPRWMDLDVGDRRQAQMVDERAEPRQAVARLSEACSTSVTGSARWHLTDAARNSEGRRGSHLRIRSERRGWDARWLVVPSVPEEQRAKRHQLRATRVRRLRILGPGIAVSPHRAGAANSILLDLDLGDNDPCCCPDRHVRARSEISAPGISTPSPTLRAVRRRVRTAATHVDRRSLRAGGTGAVATVPLRRPEIPHSLLTARGRVAPPAAVRHEARGVVGDGERVVRARRSRRRLTRRRPVRCRCTGAGAGQQHRSDRSTCS